MLIVYFSGCQKDNPEKEFDDLIHKKSIEYCKTILDNPKLPDHSRSLAESALRKWENNILDPEPILIRAFLVRPERQQTVILGLQASDEDYNILGILLRENHIKRDGKTILIEEKYPVYADEQVTITKLKLIPIKIRKNEERKEEETWENYLVVGVQIKIQYLMYGYLHPIPVKQI